MLPPTLEGLFSRAGGGKVSSPACVAAFSARTCAAGRSPGTLSGSPLLTLCARGKRLVSLRARSCVHVGSGRARVHADGSVWLDNEGKEMSHSSRVAETARGFPWLLPLLQGVHVLQQAENTQFPGCCCWLHRMRLGSFPLWRACSRRKSLQQRLLLAFNANSPAGSRARVDLLTRWILRWDARARL